MTQRDYIEASELGFRDELGDPPHALSGRNGYRKYFGVPTSVESGDNLTDEATRRLKPMKTSPCC